MTEENPGDVDASRGDGSGVMTEEDDSTEPPLLTAFRRLIANRDHWSEQRREHALRAEIFQRRGDLDGERSELRRAESASSEIQRIDDAVRERTFLKARGARVVPLDEWGAIAMNEPISNRVASTKGRKASAGLKDEALAAIADWMRGTDNAEAVVTCAYAFMDCESPGSARWDGMFSEDTVQLVSLARDATSRNEQNSERRREAILASLLNLLPKNP